MAIGRVVGEGFEAATQVRTRNLPTFALMLPFNNIQGTTLTRPTRRAPMAPGDPSKRIPHNL